MRRDVYAVAPDTELGVVAKLLGHPGLAVVAVIDDQGRPVGLVEKLHLDAREGQRTAHGSRIYYRLWNGELRMVGNIASDGRGPPGVVADVMTRSLSTIDPAEDLGAACVRMSTDRIQYLVVVARGRLVGILTTETPA